MQSQRSSNENNLQDTRGITQKKKDSWGEEKTKEHSFCLDEDDNGISLLSIVLYFIAILLRWCVKKKSVASLSCPFITIYMYVYVGSLFSYNKRVG